MERDYKKESKIKSLGYWLLLGLSFYQLYEGYGSIEMHAALSLAVILIMINNYIIGG